MLTCFSVVTLEGDVVRVTAVAENALRVRTTRRSTVKYEDGILCFMTLSRSENCFYDFFRSSLRQPEKTSVDLLNKSDERRLLQCFQAGSNTVGLFMLKCYGVNTFLSGAVNYFCPRLQ